MEGRRARSEPKNGLLVFFAQKKKKKEGQNNRYHRCTTGSGSQKETKNVVAGCSQPLSTRKRLSSGRQRRHTHYARTGDAGENSTRLRGRQACGRVYACASLTAVACVCVTRKLPWRSKSERQPQRRFVVGLFGRVAWVYFQSGENRCRSLACRSPSALGRRRGVDGDAGRDLAHASTPFMGRRRSSHIMVGLLKRGTRGSLL